MAQINKPSDYFNTKLYTGNGSTNAITGVGFQPDLVWMKRRDSSASHDWEDAVRGAGKYIRSDTTNAEVDSSGSFGITSFDSDGFSLTGSGGRTNASGGTYASWNWLAAGTAPSKTYTVKVVSDSGNKYRFDDFGTSAVTLEISEGGTYRFDQSDSSNSGHPLRFSTTSDGTHGGGSEYTTGVTTNGTPGSAGAYTEITVAASAPTLYYYCTQHSGMGGQANTPTTNSFSNFSGSIQSNISPNSTSGFSIVSYTGTGSAATIGHGLGVAPACIIFKDRDAVVDWFVYHQSTGATNRTKLNQTVASSASTFIDNTAPSSTVFNTEGGGATGTSGNKFIAYCFAEKKGFSKFGSYTGNGNTDGTFVYTGFKPAWHMVKRTNTTGAWLMYDNKRNPHNLTDKKLLANEAGAENASTDPSGVTASTNNLDILSNGFKWKRADGYENAAGGTYIYMAFAEQPLVGTNNIPATAR